MLEAEADRSKEMTDRTHKLTASLYMLDNIPNGVYYESCKQDAILIWKEACTRMAYNAKTANRVKRMEGQLRGILRMMEHGQHCKDVITQLSAVRSAVDRTIGVIVSENLLNCVATAEGDSEKNEYCYSRSNGFSREK